jgi:ABC-type branched-subunit amino acid transport system substrate-binding protein
MKKLRIFVLLLVLALVAAACGGDSEETTTTAAEGGMDETTTTTAAPDEGGTEETTTTAGEMPAEIKTDFGVDLDAGTITIGQLADLTSPNFSALVNPIIDGQKLYFDYINANGGINGLMIEMLPKDTQYSSELHIQAYEEIRDQVVAISHGTGSSTNLAIADQLFEDKMILVPATWYSGWTDTEIAPGVVHTGASYCIEAMNLLDWMKDESGLDAPTLALASLPGDFGLDSMAGAQKWAEINGIEYVDAGIGKIIPGQDNKPIGDAIVASGADIVFVTAPPSLFSEVYGTAVGQGFEAMWSGAGPTYNPAFLSSPLADAIQRDWYGGFYSQPWGSESAGMALVHQLYDEAGSEEPLKDYIALGVVEAMIVENALRKAYENGDLTREGVFNALYSFDSMEFMGMAPAERYTGSTADQVQRALTLYRPSAADFAAGGSGAVIVDPEFVGPTAESFEFTEACWSF